MAKLDKQGLNTFIRELDKHINTKINRLDISPTADKVMMADGTSVEETVSANKTSILSLQSSVNNNAELANQALEKANEAFQRGNDVKEMLVDTLIAKGVNVSTDDNFEDINIEINGLNKVVYANNTSYLKKIKTTSTSYSTTNSSWTTAETITIPDYVEGTVLIACLAHFNSSAASGLAQIRLYNATRSSSTKEQQIYGTTDFLVFFYTSGKAGDSINLQIRNTSGYDYFQAKLAGRDYYLGFTLK